MMARACEDDQRQSRLGSTLPTLQLARSSYLLPSVDNRRVCPKPFQCQQSDLRSNPQPLVAAVWELHAIAERQPSGDQVVLYQVEGSAREEVRRDV